MPRSSRAARPSPRRRCAPAAGPSQAPISTTVSPFLPPPPAPRSSPTWCAASPRPAAIRSIAPWTRSSKLRPLRVPASSASASCLRASASAARRTTLVSTRWSASPNAWALLVGATSGLGDRLGDRPLHVGERVGGVFRGKVANQRLKTLLDQLRDLFLDLVLHGRRAIRPEVLGDLLGQTLLESLECAGERAALPGEGVFELSLDRVHHATGLLQELLARSPGRALELTPHVVDLSRRILAVEHPGADLDRVDHGPAGFLAASARSRTTRAARSSETVRRSITSRSSSARTTPSPWSGA